MFTIAVHLHTDGTTPIGKLADVELHFWAPTRQETASAIGALHAANYPGSAALVRDLDECARCLAGLRLIGFAVWRGRNGQAPRVSYPARTYRINGAAHTFAVLRPLTVRTGMNLELETAILSAYAEAQAKQDATDAAQLNRMHPVDPRD